MVFAVFTLRPSDWRSRYEAFKELRDCWKALRKAITRHFGANRYVSTVEVHRSGWPHLNVVLEAPLLADMVGRGAGGGVVPWLKRHALACGFGYMLSVERAKSRRALAGYVVKLAGDVETAAQKDETGRLTGEVTKLSQVPERAPRHFRRLRSSIRFLPAPYKRPDITGKLERTPLPVGEDLCAWTGAAITSDGATPGSTVAPSVATASATGDHLKRATVAAVPETGPPATGPPAAELAAVLLERAVALAEVERGLVAVPAGPAPPGFPEVCRPWDADPRARIDAERVRCLLMRGQLLATGRLTGADWTLALALWEQHLRVRAVEEAAADRRRRDRRALRGAVVPASA